MAYLKLTPVELSEKLGLSFRRDVDDLGYVNYAWRQLPSIGLIVLESHEHPVHKGTSILVDLAVLRDSALKALASELRIEKDDIEWITSYASWQDMMDEAQRNAEEDAAARQRRTG